jgi:hypothetical protein
MGLKNFRVVHSHDIVPHAVLEEFGYRHIPQEIWQKSDTLAFVQCDPTNGEDQTCSNSDLLNVNILDHLHYLGVQTGC